MRGSFFTTTPLSVLRFLGGGAVGVTAEDETRVVFDGPATGA